MSQSELIGYARKSKQGNALKLSISAEAFENAKRYTSKNGGLFVTLVINMTKIKEISTGDREVTSVCQLMD